MTNYNDHFTCIKLKNLEGDDRNIGRVERGYYELNNKINIIVKENSFSLPTSLS